MKGVWVLGAYDVTWIAYSIYDNELDALRKLNDEPGCQVIFVEFGKEITGPIVD